MSREYDWKIHEYMGNDLTGAKWEDDSKKCIVTSFGELTMSSPIPHYSTTWEGAGLVMEWLMKNGIRFGINPFGDSGRYVAQVQKGILSDDEPLPLYSREIDPFAPLALAKAYISAMEEIDND